MRQEEIPIRLSPQGRTVHVLPGTKVLEAVARSGVTVNTPCGGQGTCGKCRVKLLAGETEPTAAEKTALTEAELEVGLALACQRIISGPMSVETPESSLLASFHQILMGDRDALDADAERPVVKRYLELPPPSLEDCIPDLDRLQRETGPLDTDLEVLQSLPGLLRKSSFRGTAVLAHRRLIGWEAGDTTASLHVAAFDIGTTTLGGVLLDLHRGLEVASASQMNPQTVYGDDVLARILYARDGRKAREEMQATVVAALNDLIENLAVQAGIDARDIYAVTFSGNTTMQHLLLGIEPNALGEIPFAAGTSGSVTTRADELGIVIHPRGRAYVFPAIGGFVGGDTVAGILTTKLHEKDEPSLLLDIGTNGEICLWSRDTGLFGASCAAGPAFEGARISQGMRATTGAIEKVVFEDGDIHCNVIGNAAPVGVCGSALIDAAAELLRLGVIAPQGLLVGPDDLPEGAPTAIRRRLIERDGRTAFVLASAEESGMDDEAVTLTQKDFAELQLATAAIRAGITILLERAGLEPSDLAWVYVAGGFGNYIRRSNAQRIGLLPRALPRERIVSVGNTSLAGACLAAASTEARRQAEAVARQTRHVELSQDPAFQNLFVESMFFPDEVSPWAGAAVKS